MSQNITSLIGQVVTIGGSSIVGITVMPGEISLFVQYLSGGTIWVGGSTLSIGTGYLWDVSNIKALSFEDFSGTVYMIAGVTAQISVLYGRSPGFE